MRFDLGWQRQRATEDRQGQKWSKSTPTHLCAQYFMGQRRIAKTCHEKISDFDWYLLHRVIRNPPVPLNLLNHHLYQMDFFLWLCRKKWSECDKKSSLLSLQSDAVNSVSLLYSTVNIPPRTFICHCCFTCQTKRQWQMHRTKHWIPESERIRHDDTKEERLEGFPLCNIFNALSELHTCNITTLIWKKSNLNTTFTKSYLSQAPRMIKADELVVWCFYGHQINIFQMFW